MNQILLSPTALKQARSKKNENTYHRLSRYLIWCALLIAIPNLALAISAITGSNRVCQGLTTTLADATIGGSWSSSNPAVATIGSGTGVVTGITVGTAVITYTATSGFATLAITVNPLPSPISGTPVVCVGSTTTLTNTGGGTWASSPTTVATIGATSGVMTGVAAGSATITYTLTTGCKAYVTATINPLPGAITGTAVVCAGLSSTLSSTTSGGTWSSSNTAIATVGATSGVLTGVSAGNATITYTLGTGCRVIKTATVNALPAAIGGTTAVCVGKTTTLTDATAGGTWTSGNTAIATVIFSSGIVTGISAGTATITYRLATGCINTVDVTVNPLPMPIAGVTPVCAGLSTTLSGSGGGVWSSGNTAIVTIGSTTGVATGVSAGSANITYTLVTGCRTTTVMAVRPLPAVIGGPTTVCTGSIATLTDATLGGVWSSGSTGVATVGSTGRVTGVSSGSVNITYTLSTGCLRVQAMTVNPTPAAITGGTTICPATSTTLSDATGGGVWISNRPATATVGSTSGTVTGVVAGTATISYQLPTGCASTSLIIVNPLPAAVTGTASVCVAGVTTLVGTGGGTWTSGGTGTATVDTFTGVVTGVSAGTTTITYILGTGCTTTKLVTVNPLPAAISGSSTVCATLTTPLTDADAGGTWFSNSTGVANVGITSGILTGYTAGYATVTYKLGTGCTATLNVTVNPLPATIIGIPKVCVGSTTVYANSTTGGTWTSSNTAVATIGVSTGIISGISAGTSVITYTLSTGCLAVRAVTVNPLPATISGASAICQGLSTTFTDAITGGTWASTNVGIANVGVNSGLVYGTAPGTATITYRLNTGCTTTKSITVNPLPSTITGTAFVCLGLTTTLTDGGGGTWTSGNPAVATIGISSGLVTGVSAGTSIVTYMLSTGCITNRTVTVKPLPNPIAGTPNVCVGLTTNLTDAGGGFWSTSNPAIATFITGPGQITGMTAGTVTVTYRLGTSCLTTSSFTVNPLPSSISGPISSCVGTPATLTNTGGGTWASSSTAIATIGSSTGIITGVVPGNVTVTYTLPTGCITTRPMLINPLPAAIVGTPTLCLGSNRTFTNTVIGGTWSTSGSVATVGSSTGLVTAVSTGVATITYGLSTGCVSLYTVTVLPLPAAITGTTTACVTTTTTLSNSTGGGYWSSSNTAIATVGSATGVVTMVRAGTATISYTIGTGCASTITVGSIPPAISGVTSICTGTSTTLTNTGGGTWLSSNGAVAPIGSTTGIVTGRFAGSATIFYILPGGCTASTIVNVVSTVPAITGNNTICGEQTTLLIDPAVGGTWSSSDVSLATVGSSTGLVTGVGGGMVTITYSLGTGCYTTKTMSAYAFALITGPTSLCNQQSVTLTDRVTGGIWTSYNTTIATVGSTTGVVFGVTGGYVPITYTLGVCRDIRPMMVNPLSDITGPSTVCVGQAIKLVEVGAGTWISSAPAAGSIEYYTGLVSGISAGTTVITYTLSTGCRTTKTVTVYPLSVTTGPNNVCVSQMITLANITPGTGTWTSGNMTIATIGSGDGVVTGVSGGTANISYTTNTGCRTTYLVYVNPLSPIVGPSSVCVGQSITLTDAVGGGSWSSPSGVGIATVDSATSFITGIAAGTSIITYTLPTGCITSKSITINPLTPTVVPSGDCVGQTITLTNPTAGGTWSSGNPTIGIIGSTTGVVTGISGGVAIISYTTGTGCLTTALVAVNPRSEITGPGSVCVAQSITLSNPIGGGTWSTPSGLGIATIDSASSLLTGLVSGFDTVYYTLPSGCISTKTVVVNPSTPIVVPGSTCVGQTVTLTNPTPGGTWSSGNPTIGNVGVSTGIVTGVSGGTANISYTITSTGCRTTAGILVNNLGPITGLSQVCAGQAITLSCGVGGGRWTSSSTGIATVGATTGSVRGVSAGSPVISYTLPTGCMSVKTLTVNPLSAITGPTSVCSGLTITLANSTPGGTWSSSNPTIASINPTTGLVTGALNGSTNITYTLGTGCKASSSVLVPFCRAANGTRTVCEGSTIVLTEDVPGGKWYTTDNAIVAVNEETGVALGIAPGKATIYYTVPTTTGFENYSTQIIVSAPIAPAFIAANPGANITEGQTVTLTAKQANVTAGATYQWVVNGAAVTGANSATYTTSELNNNDVVSCEIVSPCGEVATVNAVTFAVSSKIATAKAEFALMPNPNNGTFTLKGKLGTMTDENLAIEVADMLGRTVYTGVVTAHNGVVNERVSLNTSLPAGAYLLNVRSANERTTVRFVIEQ